MPDIESSNPPLDPLEIGDMVFLRTGGPRMSVTAIEGDLIACTWFSESENDFRTIQFPPECLIRDQGLIPAWVLDNYVPPKPKYISFDPFVEQHVDPNKSASFDETDTFEYMGWLWGPASKGFPFGRPIRKVEKKP